jgi:rare lipoprotein A
MMERPVRVPDTLLLFYSHTGIKMKTFRLILVMLLFGIEGAMQAALAADVREGEASYYANSLNGNKTASGEPYNKNAFSAAHRSLPFGTKVKVTYLKSGQSVEVVINDRGPYAKDRIIDLSGAAAKKIGLTDAGHGKVRLEVMEP